MFKFDTFLKISELPSLPIKYRVDHGSVTLDREGNFPYSVTENEFNVLRWFVIRNDLKYGFELGTGCGISTTALGMGFKETGGRLLSMDAYTEEKFQAYTYEASVADVHMDAIGYKSARFLMQHFDLEQAVTLYRGWSPTSVEVGINTFLGHKLDFVFIDGMHTDKAIMDDINAILPFLDSRFAIFFHDVHCFSDNINKFLHNTFGRMYKVIDTCVHNDATGYNLACLNMLGSLR